MITFTRLQPDWTSMGEDSKIWLLQEKLVSGPLIRISFRQNDLLSCKLWCFTKTKADVGRCFHCIPKPCRRSGWLGVWIVWLWQQRLHPITQPMSQPMLASFDHVYAHSLSFHKSNQTVTIVMVDRKTLTWIFFVTIICNSFGRLWPILPLGMSGNTGSFWYAIINDKCFVI